MKSRLAKKIIKASATYCFYCRNCDTHSRFKYHPYWTSHWNRYGSQMKYVPTGVWRLDQRLNAALRRLPQYTQKVSSAVEAKLMEIKRNMLHKMLERQQPDKALKKEKVMRMYPHQSTEKWNVYNGNLLDRKASRELTMLYKRRMEEEKSKGEFVPYRTYFRCSKFNIKE